MFDTARLLDAAKSRQAIPSDYKLAKTLGVGQSLISGYRAGRSRPNDAIARQLAGLAGLDPDVLVLELHAERAQTDEDRHMWQAMASRLAAATRASALAFVAAILSLFVGVGPDAGAHAATPLASISPGSSVYYVNHLARVVLHVARRCLHFVANLARSGYAGPAFA